MFGYYNLLSDAQTTKRASIISYAYCGQLNVKVEMEESHTLPGAEECSAELSITGQGQLAKSLSAAASYF